jgi:hypothetical protein
MQNLTVPKGHSTLDPVRAQRFLGPEALRFAVWHAEHAAYTAEVMRAQLARFRHSAGITPVHVTEYDRAAIDARTDHVWAAIDHWSPATTFSVELQAEIVIARDRVAAIAAAERAGRLTARMVCQAMAAVSCAYSRLLTTYEDELMSRPRPSGAAYPCE